MNLIANKALPHGIHRVGTTMHIQCNVGFTTTNQQGWLRNFPELVWYNTNGVLANIMSPFVVKKYYRVEYDNYKQDALHVTKPDRSVMIIEPTKKGLYALANHSTGWVHVNTVADRRHEYTKRKYRDALLACGVQNIIMFPAM